MRKPLRPWHLNGKSIGYTCGAVYYVRRTMFGRKMRFSTGCVTEEAALAEYHRFELSPLTYRSPLGRRAVAGKPLKGKRQSSAASLDAWRRRMNRCYRLTPEAHAALVIAQGGRCAICETPAEMEPAKALSVDHGHGTGVVRGLLCSACNRGLGHFRDSPILLRAAATYLESRAGGADSAVSASHEGAGATGPAPKTPTVSAA